jgi:hypothetical protein
MSSLAPHHSDGAYALRCRKLPSKTRFTKLPIRERTLTKWKALGEREHPWADFAIIWQTTVKVEKASNLPDWPTLSMLPRMALRKSVNVVIFCQQGFRSRSL